MKKSNRVGKAYALNYELYFSRYHKVRDEWLLGAGNGWFWLRRPDRWDSYALKIKY
jgi:hypothetical protein